MTESREPDQSDAELTPQAHEVKEILEQGVRDFVDLEAFKAAGDTQPVVGAAAATSAPTAGEPPPGAATPGEPPPGAATPGAAPPGVATPGAAPDLPTEADAAAYLWLLETDGSAQMGEAIERDARDAEIVGDGEPGTKAKNSVGLFYWMALGLLILAVVVALGAGRLLRNPSTSPDDSAAPAAGNPAQGAPASGSCVLDETAIVAQSALTDTITKQDSTQTTYVGQSTFTNTTTAPVYLNLKGSQNFGVPGEAPAEEWLEYQILVPAGGMHTAEVHAQVWSNRAEQTWKIITGYAAYPATDACVAEVGGSEQLDVLSRAVDNPLPVGPGTSG